MIVVVLENCPPSLRGDMTKWFTEINTGVYVGNFSARVRDELWERICEHLKSGRATMVFPAQNEQRMDFRVHNTAWTPVDFDGLRLMRRPAPPPADPDAPLSGSTEGASGSGGSVGSRETAGFSKAAVFRKQQRISAAKRKALPDTFCVLDLETTGLDATSDAILELAALRIKDGAVSEQFETFVRTEHPIPEEIRRLTGICPEMLRSGLSLPDALRRLTEFLGTSQIVCHNASFDQSFLFEAFRTSSIPYPENTFSDTLILAKKKLKHLPDYKLTTIAEHFSLPVTDSHRALADCLLTFGILMKLKEL